MQAHLIKAIVALLALLPLPLNHRIGASLGWLAWICRTRLRRTTEVNLELCFPTYSAAERKQIARKSLEETGKTLTEAAWIWRRPRAQIDALVQTGHGKHLLREAQSDGHGVLVATPHLGAWELCSQPLTESQPMLYMYRSPRNHILEPLLIKWRSNLDGWPARLDRGGIKTALQRLKQGGIVGVLPDQEPDRESGVFADFFGVPANTMTLLPKIANRGGATVLFCCAERLPRGTGWKIHFVEADPDIAHSDKAKAAIALNRSVERCISICPSQYLWNYRRFRLLSDGGKRSYQ